MPASNSDKAARRAREYRDRIAVAQAEGNYRDALHEANRWLLSELNRAAKQRPQHAAATYAEVTERVAALAEALPAYRPARRGPTDVAS